MSSSTKLCIVVSFLTGRYVATSHNDRRKSEWPPHPARLFSALVSTWVEDGCESTELAALKWIESQNPPAIAASRYVHRSTVTHFVPVNDTTIFGLKLYKKIADKVYGLQDKLRNEVDIVHSKKIQDELSKARNVTKYLNRTGNTNPSTAKEMLPDWREKQGRFYPSITLDDPHVTYLWDSCPPDEIAKVLDGLLARIVRLGHSSSMVSCRITSDLPKVNYLPGGNDMSMRGVSSGQIAALKQRYTIHQGIRPHALPFTNIQYGFRDTTPTKNIILRPNTDGSWIVFEFMAHSRFLPSTQAVRLAGAMRAAIFHYIEDPIPEEISGHKQNGKPTDKPHLAFIPLPYVGFKHANGRLLGIAISVPKSLSDTVRLVLFRAIGAWESKSYKTSKYGQETNMQKETYETSKVLRLTIGSLNALTMKRQRKPTPTLTLRQNVWKRPSRWWVTATPIALPKHPGRLSSGTIEARSKAWAEAESSIIETCTHAGLPKPTSVNIALSPFITGARPAYHFPTFNQNGPYNRPIRRQLVHASLVFEQPVSGPLILGAGRFLGLGLMRPMQIAEPDISRDEQT